jgi:outer membrane protein
MNKRNLIIPMVILLTGAVIPLRGQALLTADDAVRIALEKNYDIRIARNDADIARLNNTPGNAGMLPGIQMNGTGNYAINNANVTFATGTEKQIPSAVSSSLSAGTQLTWKLFDGGKMFVTKNKLAEIQALGEIQYRDRVLQTLYGVISAYYDVVRQEQQLASMKEIIDFNEEQVTIARAGFEAGSLIKSDLLQARIDLNVAKENAINQQFAIDAARKTLNGLLGRDPNEAFEVADSIPLDYHPDRQRILQQADSANTTLMAFRKQIDIAKLSLKEFHSGYLPQLNVSGGYYFSRSGNAAGSVVSSQIFGPQFGGTLSIPIFSAGENRRKTATARLDLLSAEYDLSNVKLQVNTELGNALTSFANQQQLLQIEKENNELAREDLNISMERLRLGQTTTLEVHLAKENYVLSCTRLTNFEYNLKIAETRLKQLVSQL